MSSRVRSVTITEEEQEFRRLLDSVPPPSPPDGGWGWLVVVASFLINAIVDGFCHSYGVFLPELIYYYNSSESLDNSLYHSSTHTSQPLLKLPTFTLSLAGSLLLGVYMLSGPVTSALCNRFGSRRIAMYGSLISTSALLISTFAKVPAVFLIFFGIVAGFGFGMMFLAAIVVVGFYFEKKRALAATLAMCGSGVGTAAMAPILTHLFEDFQWQSVLTIAAGIVLQGMVLGAFYKPLDADFQRRRRLIMRKMEEDRNIGPQTCIIMQKLLEEKNRQRTISTGSLNNAIITRDNKVLRPDEISLYSSQQRRPSFLNRIKAAWSSSKVNLGSSRVSTQSSSRIGTPASVHKTSTHLIQNGGEASQGLDTPMSVRRLPVLKPTISRDESVPSFDSTRKSSLTVGDTGDLAAENINVDSLSVANSAVSGDRASTVSATSTGSEPHEIAKKYLNHVPDNDRPLYKKDILYTGSVPQLNEYRQNTSNYTTSVTCVPQDSIEDHGCCWARLECLPKPIRDVIRSILDASTFRSPTFVILSIASFLTMLGYFVPFLLLPGFAKSIAISPMKSSLLFSVLGLFNVVGRALAGGFGGLNCVNPILVSNIAVMIAGAFTVFVPFFDNYYYLIFYTGVFGLCMAAFSTLRSQIVVELMGLDKLTTSFGQLIIIHGIAIIVGTPIACLLYDITGNFSASFYMAGVSIFLSGVICFPLRKLADIEKAKKGLLTPSYNSSVDEVKKEAQTFANQQENHINSAA